MAQSVLTTLDFGGGPQKVTGLPAPSVNSDAATKAYVDSAVEGLSWKDSCRVATTANISLASPGATIDAITMATNDRVLVRSQTAQAENGIYIWNGAAVPLTRALDMDAAAEFEQAVVTVEEGTSAGSTFRQTAVNVTVGTTPIAWTSFGTSAPAATEATAGIAEIATQAETDAGVSDSVVLTPLKLANLAGRIRKFASTIGDGSATQFTVTHNFNTRDVEAVVYRNSGNYDQVLVDIEMTTVNACTVRFASPPAAGAFRVVVIG